MKTTRRFLTAGLAFLLLIPSLAAAQAQNAPRGVLSGVAIVQKLDSQVPLDLEFKDENGKPVRLGDYFGKRPVILSLVYFRCPMLCSYVMAGLVRSLRGMSFTAGREFEVLTVSFDPADTPEVAKVNKAEHLKDYDRPGAEKGWHFLTGDQASIRALTDAVGFQYKTDPQTGQFAHAAGIMVLTPGGKVARYFFGVDYAPRDLRLSMVEASNEKIGTPVDQVLLYCFHYDPATGKYGPVIQNILRLAGVLTVVAIALLMLILSWRSRVRHAREATP